MKEVEAKTEELEVTCETHCGSGFYAGCMGNACLGCTCNPNNNY